ncbi:putative sporulation protein [Streptomyces afghaniensis 772]|uniref:Putative sporulation protein n=2 Tax=Streptomyces TaxID=1883 RepID=S4MG37_9ACTN|nr:MULTISPECIES: helix-turn-helix transcriptional regulator [Streptomyces]EPJ34520.1 putative sporulation protein [Streptomyces afghaniensis 772]UOB12680.1 helix-turn-helix domain-containing protein [Streptomyces sp. HP-A2021]
MEGNTSLAGAMKEAGFTQAELAEAVNEYLRLHGYEGTVSDRTVRNWLTGKTRWPHPRQREALEAVFGCTAEELGFRPPAARRPTKPESPVRRRNFLTASTGTAAAVVVPDSRPTRVGTSDVIRLRSGLDTLMALDDNRGGHEGLERAAQAGADEALDKVKLAASQRIRQRLFSLAADYTATAAWSALDARRLARTQQYLDRALYLAGMAKDPVAEMRVWNSYAMLAHQRGQHTQAVDAGYAAQATAITRRDPLFASLAHARTAVGHSNLGDRTGALRSLGYAQEALEKVSFEEPRPSWVAFYGGAELTAITAIVRDRIGDPARAEAASHRALGAIPKQFRRNRALATTRLALAQLHQRDIEQACATASKVFDLMAGHPLPGRMRSLLGDYYRDLITLAPDAGVAQEWGDRFRAEWSRS